MLLILLIFIMLMYTIPCMLYISQPLSNSLALMNVWNVSSANPTWRGAILFDRMIKGKYKSQVFFRMEKRNIHWMKCLLHEKTRRNSHNKSIGKCLRTKHTPTYSAFATETYTNVFCTCNSFRFVLFHIKHNSVCLHGFH